MKTRNWLLEKSKGIMAAYFTEERENKRTCDISKTGNFHIRLILANFTIVIKT